jgi:hypothetical protein
MCIRNNDNIVLCNIYSQWMQFNSLRNYHQYTVWGWLYEPKYAANYTTNKLILHKRCEWDLIIVVLWRVIEDSMSKHNRLHSLKTVEVMLCRGTCCTKPDLFRLVPEILTVVCYTHACGCTRTFIMGLKLNTHSTQWVGHCLKWKNTYTACQSLPLSIIPSTPLTPFIKEHQKLVQMNWKSEGNKGANTPELLSVPPFPDLFRSSGSTPVNSRNKRMCLYSNSHTCRMRKYCDHKKLVTRFWWIHKFSASLNIYIYKKAFGMSNVYISVCAPH